MTVTEHEISDSAVLHGHGTVLTVRVGAASGTAAIRNLPISVPAIGPVNSRKGSGGNVAVSFLARRTCGRTTLQIAIVSFGNQDCFGRAAYRGKSHDLRPGRIGVRIVDDPVAAGRCRAILTVPKLVYIGVD